MSFYEAADLLYGYRKASVPVEGAAAIPYFENLFPDLTWADTPENGDSIEAGAFRVLGDGHSLLLNVFIYVSSFLHINFPSINFIPV
jgi:hypothetical protein